MPLEEASDEQAAGHSAEAADSMLDGVVGSDVVVSCLCDDVLSPSPGADEAMDCRDYFPLGQVA